MKKGVISEEQFKKTCDLLKERSEKGQQASVIETMREVAPITDMQVQEILKEAHRLYLSQMSLDDAPAEVKKASDSPANIFGKYIKVELIGKGGMGQVYKAWDTQLNRYVALKFLHSNVEEDDVARFLREAKISAGLNHPNIAAIYEAGRIDEQNYISMQYIEGDQLSKLKFPLIKTLEVIEQAARAIHYAHTKGIIHRDIKPQNIMVDKEGRVFVTDFGLAKRIDIKSSISKAGTILGTPVYMSPEQAEGNENIGIASDIYSLGATLYELLAENVPFTAKSVSELFHKISNEDPIPPRRHNKNIPKDVEVIILKAMQKEPAKRYASMQEFADDIRSFILSRPIKARPPTIVGKIRKAIKRRPATFIIGLVSLIAMAFLAIFVIEQQKKRGYQKELKIETKIHNIVEEIWKWDLKLSQIDSNVVAVYPEIEKLQKDIETILKKYPQMACAYYVMSLVYLRLGKLQEALSSINNAIKYFKEEEFPEKAKYYYQKAMVENQIREEKYLQKIVIVCRQYQKKLENEMIELSQSIKKNLSQAISYGIKGGEKSFAEIFIKLLDEKYAEVISEGVNIINEGKAHDLCIVNKLVADAYMYSKRYKEAAEYYERAIEKRRSFHQAYFMLVLCYISQATVSNLEGEDPSEYIRKAIAKCFDFKLRRIPFDEINLLEAMAHIAYADYYISKKQLEQVSQQLQDAINSLDEFLLRNTQHAGAIYHKAKCFFKKAKNLGIDKVENLKKALELTSEVINLMPEDHHAYELRALCYAELADLNSEQKQEFLQKAIDDYTRVLDFEPDNAPYIHFRRGGLYYAINKKEEMYADFIKAIEGMPLLKKYILPFIKKSKE